MTFDPTQNRATLSPEAVAQLVADREAGTPGPWHFDGPVWNQIIWTDGENRLCFMAHSNGLNDDRDIANARRIAHLPDIEAAYLTLAAENATLRAERDAWTKIDVARDVDFATLRASEAAALGRVKVLEEALMIYADSCDETETKSCGYDGNMCCRSARAALTPTADKEPTT